MVKTLNNENFEQETSKGVVLVDFWAPWCGPCRMQSPIIDELDEEMGDKVTFAKVNIDDNEKLSEEFRIMSIPMLLIKKDGQIVDTLIGLHNKTKLIDVLNKYI
ncbi:MULTISPECIES: thioredoxin [unclassified Granulicatella]|uniref:thioredoxin n=1 Tax=unclassified Granulicatella TaxID=2630493 RepID=UPI001073070E|nr:MULTISPECIES: thioredoxin [unclassified Granulicatella]MBF0780073.1 thioredoxin [Granulicatella sp. 19428wC4_WM01]TFU95856.1 thioredoxin [Granulicatella sp. WM01]